MGVWATQVWAFGPGKRGRSGQAGVGAWARYAWAFGPAARGRFGSTQVSGAEREEGGPAPRAACGVDSCPGYRPR
eukprot:1330607-Prymnesium_polylepis.1